MGVAVFLITLTACAHALDKIFLNAPGFRGRLHETPDGELQFFLEKNATTVFAAKIGKRAGAIQKIHQGEHCLIQFRDDTSLKIRTKYIKKKPSAWMNSHVVLDDLDNTIEDNNELCDHVNELKNSDQVIVGNIITLTWNAPNHIILEDCMHLGILKWYGGPQHVRQHWPIERNILPESPYITRENNISSIAEPYWLNSEGVFLYFDKKVPLFVDHNIKQFTCFKSFVKHPYSYGRDRNEMVYYIGLFENTREAHKYAIQNYLWKPKGIPDERMITYPVWTTWTRYKNTLDHFSIITYAKEIFNHGFRNSHMDIDSNWEICYGSLFIDQDKFYNFTETIRILNEMRFRVTLRTHPFINRNCEPFYTEALKSGFLVSSATGSLMTSWWNAPNGTSSLLDFTKGQGRRWYIKRLRALMHNYGFNSYNFDAGESGWAPPQPILQGDVRAHPGQITWEYVRIAAHFGPMAVVRTGSGTQDLPIFVRMLEKNSTWTFDNGFPTLLPTLFQMNMNGYPLVMPSVIGGQSSEKPSKELFIRWLQATTFMPNMRFGHVPWDYDMETINISMKYVDLHEMYTPVIIGACKRAAEDGTPVNPPIWWIAPTDQVAQDIWDEYLLGDTILVAPVIQKGAKERLIYLPPGHWLEEGDTKRKLDGGQWYLYPAPLGTLPYFVRW